VDDTGKARHEMSVSANVVKAMHLRTGDLWRKLQSGALPVIILYIYQLT